MTKEEAITALGDRNNLLWGMSKEEKKYYSEALDMAISALKGGWIPIVTRPMTEEEKEEYHGEYDPDEIQMYAYPLPEDGKEVLITTCFGDVITDTFYRDDGYYFGTYCDDGEVVAWQPKPEPYKKGE